MITQGKAAEAYAALNSDGIKAGLVGTVNLVIHNESGEAVGVQELYHGTDVDDMMLNQSLDTAKIIFSKLAAGMVDHKIAKIAFGNAGHNFLNPKQAVDAVATDIGLKSAEHIVTSLDSVAVTDHYLYTDTNAVTHRMVYVEKDILPEHITYGAMGNQFVVRVPISYDEFNMRVGGATTTDVGYDTSLISYTMVNPNDGTLIRFGDVDAAGAPLLEASEVYSWDDAGTTRYAFLNGINGSGVIDTVNGGDRPQEISEILLCADITGDGTVEAPYQKLASSRMTSGLLAFPEGFTFTYEWSLSWNFV